MMDMTLVWHRQL